MIVKFKLLIKNGFLQAKPRLLPHTGDFAENLFVCLAKSGTRAIDFDLRLSLDLCTEICGVRQSTQKGMPEELDGDRLAETAIGKTDRVAL